MSHQWVQQYLFDFDDVTVPVEGGPPVITLADARPYQREWREATYAKWDGCDRLLGVAGTATGKTFGAALVIRDVLDGRLDKFGRDRRAIFIAPRRLLVEQAAFALQSLMPDKIVEVEMADRFARGTADVVVASVDSICKKRRLKFFHPDKYAAAVWDEAHAYGDLTKKSKTILDHFGTGFKHLGITATPDRTDGRIPFKEVAFSYDVMDAVADGWLVPPVIGYEICGDVRVDGLKVGDDGDYDADSVDDLMRRAGPLAAVVTAAVKWSNWSKNGRPGRRPTIICCASVKHAKLVAKLLNEQHRLYGTGRAGAVYSAQDDDERLAVMAGFECGDLQYICHYEVLTEGYDSDRPKVFVNGRPSRSRRVFAQNAGRLLRPKKCIRAALAAAPDANARRCIIAASDKPGALIIDVVGGTHGLSVDLMTIFRAAGDDDEILKRASAKAKKNADLGLPADVKTEIQLARAEVRKEKEAAEERRWDGVSVEAVLTTTFVKNPFSPEHVPGREPPWHRGRRPSLPMIQCLLRAGIPRKSVEGYSFWDAKKVMDAIASRRKAGLCSYKQLAALRANGVDGYSMTFDEASAELDRLFGGRRREVPCE